MKSPTPARPQAAPRAGPRGHLAVPREPRRRRRLRLGGRARAGVAGRQPPAATPAPITPASRPAPLRASRRRKSAKKCLDACLPGKKASGVVLPQAVIATPGGHRLFLSRRPERSMRRPRLAQRDGGRARPEAPSTGRLAYRRRQRGTDIVSADRAGAARAPSPRHRLAGAAHRTAARSPTRRRESSSARSGARRVRPPEVRPVAAGCAARR